MAKISVLTFTGYYLPGFKGGGPIRTIANMLDKLGDEVEFSLVASDRDMGDKSCYPNTPVNQWTDREECKIYYLSPGIGGLFRVWQIIRGYQGEILYLNSFFSLRFSVLPFLFWRFLWPKKKIILVPRGEFSLGALALKSFKKKAFIALARFMGVYESVFWCASTEHEVIDIRRVFGARARVLKALNISCPPIHLNIQSRQQSAPLRIVFLSRISPKKNLLEAIQVLQLVKCAAIFDVYGPIEDEEYWCACLDAAQDLPAHVKFSYCGVIYPAKVAETFGCYDLFYFPTRGENFGHVIAEALGCGLPVLIADTTPWRDLERRGLGWDISLNKRELFVEAIEKCASIKPGDYMSWRLDIRAWAVNNIGGEDAVNQNRQLFLSVGESKC